MTVSLHHHTNDKLPIFGMKWETGAVSSRDWTKLQIMFLRKLNLHWIVYLQQLSLNSSFRWVFRDKWQPCQGPVGYGSTTLRCNDRMLFDDIFDPSLTGSFIQKYKLLSPVFLLASPSQYVLEQFFSDKYRRREAKAIGKHFKMITYFKSRKQ